ncbi:MAG: energy transducer TonB [Alteromonas sp.]|nr:energy transducer TonB [Alteromonas sp.]|tara:strand:+ start:9266 stop:9715 length:450 start_codon:yes stop_codon:yes gene_type:complete
MKKYLVISLISLLAGCASNQLTTDSQAVDSGLEQPADESEFASLWTQTKRVNPQYPISAAKDGLSGCVNLSFVVNNEGRVTEQQVTDSFPKGVFEKKAIEALKRWRWKPTTANPDNQPARSTVQLDFMVQYSKNITEAEQRCSIKIPSF